VTQIKDGTQIPLPASLNAFRQSRARRIKASTMEFVHVFAMLFSVAPSENIGIEIFVTAKITISASLAEHNNDHSITKSFETLS
jgi:hypothetical protein